jgi:hypothetical protein
LHNYLDSTSFLPKLSRHSAGEKNRSSVEDDHWSAKDLADTTYLLLMILLLGKVKKYKGGDEHEPDRPAI